MTPAETTDWILQASVDDLERKVREFRESDHPMLLTWALKVQNDPTIASAAGIRWAVAIIGTLAPDLFEDEDVLGAEFITEE